MNHRTLPAVARSKPAKTTATKSKPKARRPADRHHVPNDATGTLADELEPLVKAQWKRDGKNFLRG